MTAALTEPVVTRSALTLAVFLFFGVPAAVATDAGTSQEQLVPDVVAAPFTGDWPEIRERGVLRALVSPSRTDFFLQGARPRGILVEQLQQYARALDKQRKRGELPLNVTYVIVPFSDLIPALLEGRGDIAVANFTVTPTRKEKVAFLRGKKEGIDELLVTNKRVHGIRGVDDLSGRQVVVLAGSSYAEHLRAHNARLDAAGKAPIRIREADRRLATEDILELVNAGAYMLTVADDYRARLWAEVLPDIVVRDDVKVNEGGEIGWALRKTNPVLLEKLEAVAPKVSAGSLIGNTLIKRYYGTTRWIENPVSPKRKRRLDGLMAHIRKYAERYDFDWLAVAAQGYQESRLKQDLRSPAGAIGVMQLLPSTAADPNVNIPDISGAEANIHAGVKYLAFLRDRYFGNPTLAPEDRMAFSWAAYNAGPTRVERMREKAEKMGLDPDRWYGNVEHAALTMVGQETVNYVRNVYKYYLTYSSLLDRDEQRRTFMDKVTPPKRPQAGDTR